MSASAAANGAGTVVGLGGNVAGQTLLGAMPATKVVTLANDEFDAFYRASYDRLLRQLFVVLGELPEAEDVVQEAFARAAVRWRRVRTYDSPEAWVRRVAMNLASNSLPRARRRAAFLLRLRTQPPAPELSLDGVAVQQALLALPLRYRQVIVLHYLEDMGVEEISGVLELPVGTVKSRLARARDQLAGALDVADDEGLQHG